MHRRKGHTEREDDGWVVSVMVWKKGAGVALFALFALLALVCWFVGWLLHSLAHSFDEKERA